MASQALKSNPDVGLDVLDQVPEVDVPVGIRQSARDEKAPGHVVPAVIAPRPWKRTPRGVGLRSRNSGGLWLRGCGGDLAPALRVIALMTLIFAPRPARAEPARDPWWGPDKALHFGVSAGLAAGGYALGALVFEPPWQRALAGASLSLSAGIAKEVFDAAGSGDASFKDLAWDGLGTGVGIGAALLIDLALGSTNTEPPRRRATLTLSF
jgi:putative lipoprotein